MKASLSMGRSFKRKLEVGQSRVCSLRRVLIEKIRSSRNVVDLFVVTTVLDNKRSTWTRFREKSNRFTKRVGKENRVWSSTDNDCHLHFAFPTPSSHFLDYCDRTLGTPHGVQGLEPRLVRE